MADGGDSAHSETPVAAAPARERKKRTIRNDELANYYLQLHGSAAGPAAPAGASGTASGPTSPAGTSSGGRDKSEARRQATDLDSAGFKPKVYLKSLLKSNNLQQLLKSDSDLLKEIKFLDNNMKTLVYDNYSKFITAADTIHKMKSKVESMEDELSRLVVNISKISSSSERISGTLQEKREQIDQLSGVHHLLQKLQFLVELPSRLRQSIAMSAYGEAVTYYAKTHQTLEKYRHFPSFAPIASECLQIISDLKAVIKEKFANPETKAGAMSEYVALLLDLHEPALALRDQFLDGQVKSLGAVMGRYVSLPAVSPQASAPAQAPKAKLPLSALTKAAKEAERELALLTALPPGGRIHHLNDAFLPSYLHFTDAFGAHFLTRCKVAREQRQNLAALTASVVGSIEAYLHVVAAQLSQASQLPDPLMIAATTGAYFASPTAPTPAVAAEGTEASSAAPAGPPPLGPPPIAPFPQIMAVLGSAEHGITQMLNGYYDQLAKATAAISLAPPLSPAADRRGGGEDEVLIAQLHQPSHYIDELLLSLLNEYFGELTRQINQSLAQRMSALDQAQLHLKDYLLSAITEISNIIVYHMRVLFYKITPLSEACSNGKVLASKMFLHNLNAKIQALFQQIAHIFLKFTEQEDPKNMRLRPMLLLLCLTLGRLKTVAVPMFEHAVKGLIQSGVRSDSDNAGALVEQLQEASHAMLFQYVGLEGIKLGQLIRTAVEATPWAKHREPTDVDSWVEVVVRELSGMKSLVGVMFEDSGLPSADPRAASDASGSRRLSRNSSSSSLNSLSSRNPSKASLSESTRGGGSGTSLSEDSTYDSLFHKKATAYFDRIEFDLRSILSGIIKLALKTFLESVRLNTFEKYGYQQIQLDCRYLSHVLGEFVTDEGVVNAMLSDVLTSTKDRCLDPTPMDRTILEQLCSARLASRAKGPADHV